MEDGEVAVVVDYSAGGNPNDKHVRNISSIDTISKLARNTAITLYKERYGRKPKRVDLEFD